ncbi:MAG TPA: hypothetical protein VFW24_15485 [Acidimicrobiales bacterium]|nr:hypothetical protein [Acidimicrobiales bacterium]
MTEIGAAAATENAEMRVLADQLGVVPGQLLRIAASARVMARSGYAEISSQVI